MHNGDDSPCAAREPVLHRIFSQGDISENGQKYTLRGCRDRRRRHVYECRRVPSLTTGSLVGRARYTLLVYDSRLNVQSGQRKSG
jgi:hypothetical protein